MRDTSITDRTNPADEPTALMRCYASADVAAKIEAIRSTTRRSGIETAGPERATQMP
jgi:hypothetical protein